MPNLISRSLSVLINKYLQCDPDISQRLSPLLGKTCLITITDLAFPCRLFLHFNLDEKVLISDDYQDEIDVELRGSWWVFAKKSLNRSAQISGKEIEFIGDVEVGHHLNQLMSNLEIDWEEILSRYTGDVIAYQVGEQVRNAWQWLTDTIDTGTANLSEYLQEEVKQFPPRAEIEDFCMDVDLLSMDVARLEARWNIFNEKNPT